MPTVIALDVSLSMSQPVVLPDSTENYQKRHMAIHGINKILDHMSSSYKLEFVSLVAFSYLWELLVPFTRDFDSVKAALNKVEAYSKTCVETVLSGIKNLITDEWSRTPSQVILVTDGNLGIGAGSLRKSLDSMNSRQSTDEKFPLPYPFPCKLHIICIGNPNSPETKAALPYYQRLIDIGGNGGEVHTLDGPVDFKTVTDMVQKLSEKYYSPFCGTLSCGHFKCAVHLFPRPDVCIRQVEDEQENYSVSEQIDILGFLDVKDVGSPPTSVRHLILPRSSKDIAATEGKENKPEKGEEEEEGQDDGKTPSFTVLLHGSLKVETMVALARVQDNWYGIIYSWADSKKKSNLMLGLFEPGQEIAPWLGKLDQLTSCKEFLPEGVYSDAEKKSPFPLRPPDKRSYAQSCVVWIKPSGLQSDMQKVMRHARKLPDKLPQFYKELNRTRRAALSFGFLTLLDAMASMLERECTMLAGGSATPSAALQLTHAASALRSERAQDVTFTIMPLQTNFAGGAAS